MKAQGMDAYTIACSSTWRSMISTPSLRITQIYFCFFSISNPKRKAQSSVLHNQALTLMCIPQGRCRNHASPSRGTGNCVSVHALSLHQLVKVKCFSSCIKKKIFFFLPILFFFNLFRDLVLMALWVVSTWPGKVGDFMDDHKRSWRA
jgi:hypothetical protein